MTKKRTDTWNKKMTSFYANSKVRLLRQKLVCYVANISGRVYALSRFFEEQRLRVRYARKVRASQTRKQVLISGSSLCLHCGP